jgi:hypothetical protein
METMEYFAIYAPSAEGSGEYPLMRSEVQQVYQRKSLKIID